MLTNFVARCAEHVTDLASKEHVKHEKQEQIRQTLRKYYKYAAYILPESKHRHPFSLSHRRKQLCDLHPTLDVRENTKHEDEGLQHRQQRSDQGRWNFKKNNWRARQPQLDNLGWHRWKRLMYDGLCAPLPPTHHTHLTRLKLVGVG